jgi:hypothetical protein
MMLAREQNKGDAMTSFPLKILGCAVGLLAIPQTTPGQEQPTGPARTSEQRLSDALRDVINRGADLYNPPTRDHNGCYRLFQGALMTARVQLDSYPELQREIETALTEAERQGPDGQRAFTLRRALDRIRTALGQKTSTPRPAEAKPEDRATNPPADIKKPENGKKTEPNQPGEKKPEIDKPT